MLLQLAFVYLPTMNLFFSSAPLPGDIWLRIILASIPVMAVVGIERVIIHRLTTRKHAKAGQVEAQ